MRAGALRAATAPFCELPGSVNEVGGFGEDVRRPDRADGALDGRWRGNDIAGLAGGFDTPARTPYQTRLVEEIVRREGFGRDRVPELLSVNHGAIDVDRVERALAEGFDDRDGAPVVQREEDDPVFEVAFPSALLRRLPCLRGEG